MFTYMAGVTLAEYIRRRRMSLAAVDLQSGNERIIDVAAFLRLSVQGRAPVARFYMQNERRLLYEKGCFIYRNEPGWIYCGQAGECGLANL